MVNRDFEKYIDEIECHDFFLNYSREQLTRLLGRAIIHHYPKNQVIFFQEDYRQYGYYLLDGLIKLEKSDESGSYHYVDYVKERSYFPYRDLFSQQTTTYTGYSVTEIDLMLLPVDLLEEITLENREQILYLYRNLATILEYTEKRIQMTTISSAKDRIIQMLGLWMLDMGTVRTDHVIIPYSLTISELAVVAGTTRETASRVVNQLSDEGVIKFTRKEIIYYQPDYFMDAFAG